MLYACANIKLSETRTGSYQREYRIPSSGTGSFGSGATAGNVFSMMLMGTGGPFTGNPEVNRTYYLESSETITDYLTFSSPSAFTLETANGSKNWDGTLQYSTDGQTWEIWDGETALNNGTDGKLYLCGTGNTVVSGRGSSTGDHRFVLRRSLTMARSRLAGIRQWRTIALPVYSATALPWWKPRSCPQQR